MIGLIATARRLTRGHTRRPHQSDLRRAISTAYYALFHAVSEEAANLLVGARFNGQPAWIQVYRSLNHGAAKTACGEIRKSITAPGLKLCADSFIDLQEQRHTADYDPTYRPSLADALDAIGKADAAIKSLKACPKGDRRVFVTHLILSKRR